MKTITIALTAFMLLNSIFIFAQPGSLDSTFSKNGKVKTGLLTGSSSVAIQADGRILVEQGFSVIRFNRNGTIDRTFGVNGKATTSFAGDNHGYLLGIEPDGKIVVAGYVIDEFQSYNISIARFTLTGTPDSSFGINGEVSTFNNYYVPTDVAIAIDGKILLTATSAVSNSSDIVIIRYNTDGSFDTQFGGDYTFRDVADVIGIQSSGRIVVAGYISGDSVDFGLFRYYKGGKPDSSFGKNGKTFLLFNEPNDLALQSDDKIIVLAGDSLARFTKNGKLDSSFGTNGKIAGAFHGNAVAVQQDGKIIIVGTVNNGANTDFAVARYKLNGHLDKTFGVNGISLTDFGSNETGNAVALQTDGKVIAAGSSANQCAVARYNGDNILGITNNEQLITTDKIISSDNLSLYPNPSKGSVNISYDCSKAGKMQIKLYDVSGKILLSRNDDAISGNNVFHFNLSNLLPGIYYFELINNDEKKKIKLVIEK